MGGLDFGLGEPLGEPAPVGQRQDGLVVALDPDTFARPDPWRAALLCAKAGLQGPTCYGSAAKAWFSSSPYPPSTTPKVAGFHRRLGRPSWRRGPGLFLGRPHGAVRVDAPVTLLSEEGSSGRGGRSGCTRADGQRATAVRGPVTWSAVSRTTWPGRSSMRSDRRGCLSRPPSTPTARTVDQPGFLQWWLRRSGSDGIRHAPHVGRVVVCLEGGYDFDALRSSVAATLWALTGVRAVSSEPPTGRDLGGGGVAERGSEFWIIDIGCQSSARR